jgi:ferritin-like metal-binding protein YciE
MADAKLVQYLNEAHATEMALVRTLETHSQMAPSGSYRQLLESHLAETRDHAAMVRQRLIEVAGISDIVQLGMGMAADFAAQMIALSKAPADLVRGRGGEEKLLKNAKDECASEALEIATYLALEEMARALGDSACAEMAARIRADEERMLERLNAEIPALTASLLKAEGELPSRRAARGPLSRTRTEAPARRRARRRRSPSSTAG